jgi:hypothetical protein
VGLPCVFPSKVEGFTRKRVVYLCWLHFWVMRLLKSSTTCFTCVLFALITCPLVEQNLFYPYMFDTYISFQHEQRSISLYNIRQKYSSIMLCVF